MSVKLCVTAVPLFAVKVSGKVPVAPVVPDSVPVPGAPAVNVIPAGGVPPVRDRVGAGLPVAVTVNVLDDVVVNVVLAALVKTGAGLRLRVKLAVIGASVGTTLVPHAPSASTETMEALLRLITYAAFVAFDCGARLNVASS